MGIFSKLFGKSGDDAAPQPAPRAGGRRILVVEPSMTVAKVVELTLDGDSVATASTAAQARAAGVTEILAKPFAPQQLLAAIARVTG